MRGLFCNCSLIKILILLKEASHKEKDVTSSERGWFWYSLSCISTIQMEFEL